MAMRNGKARRMIVLLATIVSLSLLLIPRDVFAADLPQRNPQVLSIFTNAMKDSITSPYTQTSKHVRGIRRTSFYGSGVEAYSEIVHVDRKTGVVYLYSGPPLGYVEPTLKEYDTSKSYWTWQSSGWVEGTMPQRPKGVSPSALMHLTTKKLNTDFQTFSAQRINANKYVFTIVPKIRDDTTVLTELNGALMGTYGSSPANTIWDLHIQLTVVRQNGKWMPVTERTSVATRVDRSHVDASRSHILRRGRQLLWRNHQCLLWRYAQTRADAHPVPWGR